MSDTKYSVKSGFYDAINHDRLYSADDMNQPYKSMLSAGIIEGGFAVTPQSTPDMTVNVAAGHALLGDKWVDAAAKTLTVPENTALYGRIDAVVLRVDINTGVRAADLIYRTGTPASEPEAPALIGTTGIYEVRLANITVVAGATAIAAAQISDQRGTSGCPYVTMTVGNTQIKAAVEDVLEEHPEWTTTVEDGSITLAKLAAGVIDNTLTQAGAAADAKKTGDEISGLKDALDEINDILEIPFETSGTANPYGIGAWVPVITGLSLKKDVQYKIVYTADSAYSGTIAGHISTGADGTPPSTVFDDGNLTNGSRTVYLTPTSDCTGVRIRIYGESANTNVAVVVTEQTEDAVTRNTEAIETLKGEVSDLTDEMYHTHTINLEWVENLAVVGNFITANGDKVTKPFTLYAGETVNFSTKGDGNYIFTAISKVPSLDIPVVAGYSAGTLIAQITTNNLKTYSHTATEDEYIVLCGLMDSSTVVSFDNLKVESNIDIMQNEIDGLATHDSGILKNKSVMFFGDSLTAASTSGLTGFAKRIAENYDMPYKAFFYDSADGNTSDVPVDYPRFTNYAKDGTTNRIVTGRSDSVVERVKRHIDDDTLIDYVLIECCVNDMAQALQNKGTISESYTATYDTTTTIGALEETLRYLTELGKPIRVGGFIPWTISWQVSGWFDDYVAVFEKWGVPLFDMRKTAGFNMQSCAVHRLIYSLSSDNYSAYDSTATYNLDDKVKYGGILYKCLANGTTGKVPTDTDYWMEVSSESADGTHLNSIGHDVVTGKIQQFIEGC